MDILNVVFEEFPIEGIKVLTVARDDEAIWMLEGDVAEMLYHVLIGEDTITMDGEEPVIGS